MELEEAKRLVAALEHEGVRYVVVGSMAMAAHGLIRATRDIDIFVAPGADNVARLRRALKAVFDDDPSVDEISADDLAGDYPVIQYTPPHGQYSVDILARLGEHFSFEDIQCETMMFDGKPLRVATARMLYEMKRDTIRPQDRLDAQALCERFNLEEQS